MFTSIALEWKQPVEYVMELPDMNSIWDLLDIFNPEDDENNEIPSKEDREHIIQQYKRAQSRKLKKKGE